ncbi:uncharacterized protein LOC135486001 [Lineus longissimus]|uniref:uncharacterized protein LOC135486001 n=1 Tax=Lineus longissimus TaxID=88925 RepID=UPI00315C58FC
MNLPRLFVLLVTLYSPMVLGQDLPIPPAPGLNLPKPVSSQDLPIPPAPGLNIPESVPLPPNVGPGGIPLPVVPGVGGGPVIPGIPIPTTLAPELGGQGGIGVKIGHFNCNRSLIETCKDSRVDRGDDAACYCDEFCRIMNDCCDDYDPKIYTKLVDRRREVLQKLQCSGINEAGGKIPNYPFGYLMMNTCPDAYPRNMLKYLCETDADKKDEFRMWPVSSKLTGIFYKNIYCSMCWDDTEVLHWAVEVQCEKDPKKKEKLKDNLDKLSTFTKNKGRCPDKDNNVINLMSCRKLTGFLNPFNCTGKSHQNLRNCTRTYISTCNATWRNTAIEEECISHTSLAAVTSDTKTLYKNHHCGICNYIPNEKLECVGRTPGKTQAKLEGLAVLFDAEIECEENEIYDVFARRCRPLYCHEGQELDTDRCSWLDTNRTNCPLVMLSAEEYTLYNNGTLYLHAADTYVNESSYDISNGTLLVCSDLLDTKKEDLITASGIVTVISLSISICALFLLFMVYLVLPKLRNVPGKILMSLTFALFWAQILFLVGIERTEIPELCIAFAMLIHYFFLAAFAWMTMMATDMALTFRPMNLHGTGGTSQNRFLYVSLYAWSFPAVIVVPGIVMDQFDYFIDPYNPGYGGGGSVCWFSNKMALILFFLVPCAAHLLVNFICYIYTVYNIAVVSKLAKKAKQCDKCNLFLYFKLSIIMGGTWLLAYIWIITRNEVVEYAFIILNGLQGLFLFLTFVCRTRTWRQLKRREILTTTSKSTQDTNTGMSLRYRNASYKFKHDRPKTYNSAASEGERQTFIKLN